MDDTEPLSCMQIYGMINDFNGAKHANFNAGQIHFGRYIGT